MYNLNKGMELLPDKHPPAGKREVVQKWQVAGEFT